MVKKVPNVLLVKFPASRAQGARPQPIERKERNAVERRPLNRLRAGSLRLYHSREGQADQRTTLVGRLPELTPLFPPQFKFQVCSSFMSGSARSRREKRWMRGRPGHDGRPRHSQRRPRRAKQAEREGDGNAGGDSLGPLDFLPSHPPYRNRRGTVQDRG